MKAIINDSEIRRYMSLACVYSKGNIICHEGQPCETVGFIASGSLEMVHYDQEGHRMTLARLNTHELFGDFLIHSDKPEYPGYLIAKEDTAVFYMNKESLESLLETNTKFRTFYLSYLSKKALDFSLDNKMLRLKSLRERIIFYIRSHSESPAHTRVYIESKASLAKKLNVRRPSLSRELAMMKKVGLIDYDRKSLTLLKG